MIRHLLFPATRGVLRLCGRSQRIERELAAVRTQLTRMETKMSDLLDKINSLKAAVDAERKSHAADIAAAVEKAKAAWESDDAAEHAAALAGLDEITKSLSEPAPAFSPSAN